MKKNFIKLISLVMVVAIVCGLVAVFAGCNKSDDSEKLIGFDTELAEAVGEVLGVKIKFVEIDWDVKEAMLDAGSLDVVWNGFTYTEDRDNGYYDDKRGQQIGGLDFTEMYMENKQVAVVKKANAASYTSNASFAGKKGCAEGTSAGETIVKNVLQCECAQLQKQLDVFTAVTAGTYDFGVIDLTMASEYIAGANSAYKDTLAIVELSEVEVEYYAVATKEGSNVRDALNYALNKLFENGKAAELAEKYNLTANLYDGFTKEYTLPTDGAFAKLKNNGTMVVGYTIFAPMNYFAE